MIELNTETDSLSGPPRKEFNLWAMGCSHVGTDVRVSGRESLADALRQSERSGGEGGPSL